MGEGAGDHYFKSISVLSLIDQLVKGIIHAVNRSLFNVMNILPLPGMDGLARFVEKLVYFSLSYIDEAVIAYAFKTKNENVYDAAKKGIIVYCQSWKSLLKNAVALTLLSYGFIIVCTIVFLIPTGAIALAMPAEWGVGRFLMFVLALFLGFSAKWILFDPVACTSTMLTFLGEAAEREPDPEWEARIEGASEKFRELKSKTAERMNEMMARRGDGASSEAAAQPVAPEAPPNESADATASPADGAGANDDGPRDGDTPKTD